MTSAQSTVTSAGVNTSVSSSAPPSAAVQSSPLATSSKSLSPQIRSRQGRVPGFPQRVISSSSDVTSSLDTGRSQVSEQTNIVNTQSDGSVNKQSNLSLQLLGKTHHSPGYLTTAVASHYHLFQENIFRTTKENSQKYQDSLRKYFTSLSVLLFVLLCLQVAIYWYFSPVNVP